MLVFRFFFFLFVLLNEVLSGNLDHLDREQITQQLNHLFDNATEHQSTITTTISSSSTVKTRVSRSTSQTIESNKTEIFNTRLNERDSSGEESFSGNTDDTNTFSNIDDDENSDGKQDSSIDSGDCICVPYYQCDVNDQVITDGAGIFNPRKASQGESTSEKKEVPVNEGLEPPYCGTYYVCCRAPETQTRSPYFHKCGIRNPSGINRKVLTPEGQGEADFGEWPWQAIILQIDGENNLFQCGATLIDSKHIITVAHCVQSFIDSPGDLRVRLGEWDTQKMEEFMPYQDMRIDEIILHENFNPRNLWNDIALIRFTQEVSFKPNIAAVCLPTAEDRFTGQRCVTTGWGKNTFKGGNYSNVMKEVSVPVIDSQQCQQKLRRTRLGNWFRLHDGFMCAGGEANRDSCKGDGGGPLVCYNSDGTYSLVGIVSWGIDCGFPNRPGIYVKVQKYLDWIASKTGQPLESYWSAAGNYNPDK